ncbi:hypothetical protein [Rhodococcus daqingensis]|uniref:Uncharacterized protein n=1 Tax=Rhodococcus daqingensis TaxID=2479363 RepID=A0ABW2S1D8_9NOCA
MAAAAAVLPMLVLPGTATAASARFYGGEEQLGVIIESDYSNEYCEMLVGANVSKSGYTDGHGYLSLNALASAGQYTVSARCEHSGHLGSQSVTVEADPYDEGGPFSGTGQANVGSIGAAIEDVHEFLLTGRLPS